MSLLKSLQASITCVSTPWMPGAYPESCRLINEIVLGEESDLYQGRSISHFDLYLEAMRQVGANTVPVESFLRHLREGRSLSEAMAISSVPVEAQEFVRTTFALIGQKKPHVTAAAFTYGREDVIPAMFREMVRELQRDFPRLSVFDYYLQRHIELDGDSHGTLAMRMLEDLCEGSTRKRMEAENAGNHALEARVHLWDAILERIKR